MQQGDISTRSSTLLRNKARGHWLQPDSLSTGPSGRDTSPAAAARPAASPSVRRPQRGGQAAQEPQQPSLQRPRPPQASPASAAPPLAPQASPTPAPPPLPPPPIAARPQRGNTVCSHYYSWGPHSLDRSSTDAHSVFRAQRPLMQRQLVGRHSNDCLPDWCSGCCLRCFFGTRHPSRECLQMLLAHFAKTGALTYRALTAFRQHCMQLATARCLAAVHTKGMQAMLCHSLLILLQQPTAASRCDAAETAGIESPVVHSVQLPSCRRSGGTCLTAYSNRLLPSALCHR